MFVWELCSSTWLPFPRRRASLGEDPLKTSSQRRPVTIVSSLVDRVPCIVPCIRGSSTCVIYSCWFECFLSFSPLCSSCSSRDSAPFVKDRAIGFYPTSTWYHEPRWSRFRSLPSSFSSLILLCYSPISKSPPKIAPIFLWFVGLTIFCWFWSMDLLGFKWI